MRPFSASTRPRRGGGPVVTFGLLIGFAFIFSPFECARSTSSASADKPLVFESYESVVTDNIPLSNGKEVANAKEWRTFLTAVVGTEPNSKVPITCSGTFVGPGVLLTAAHCFDRGASAGLISDIEIKVDKTVVTARCTVATEYVNAVKAKVWNGRPPRVSADYALCAIKPIEKDGSSSPDLQYDVIDMTNPAPVNFAVLITGFGCSRLSVDHTGKLVNVQPDQVLRIGDAKIAVSAPLNGSSDSDYIQVYSSIMQPALCPGDSGGPLLTGITVSEPSGLRRIRGVNSTIGKGSTKDGDVFFVSKFAALATPAFTDFVRDWLICNPGRIICGVNQPPGAKPCAN